MCGIVGYAGTRDAVTIVFEGLKRLEYRGYDSAGIAVIQDGAIAICREVGKLGNLEKLLAVQPITGSVAMGHTRWATHGRPSQSNAHPHVDCSGQVVLIQNGIVENYRSLRQELKAEGHLFTSETDTEVIVHLVERSLQQGHDLLAAVRHALQRIEGAQAVVVMSSREPDRIVAARLGNAGGVTVGMGQGEMFVASDMPAILEYTRHVSHLESRELAVISASGAEYCDLGGRSLRKEVHAVPWDPIAGAKGEFRHFMQKEIHEQAEAITHTISGRVDFEHGQVQLGEMNLSAGQAREIDKIVIVACGTSAYAGLVGKFLIESLARIPVEVDYGSEFRYRDPLVDRNTAVLAITQSGETVDTLAAMEEARAKGARLWAIVNVAGSQAARLSDGAMLMHAGPEIGVCSTKAFTTSLVDLYLLGLYLGELRGTLSAERESALLDALVALPAQVSKVLESSGECEELAGLLFRCQDFLYLGRGINYPIALEGALKLKEISYIHAEGYPAGEMKHGPIALIDEHMPVVTIAVKDSVYKKMISQIEQVKARAGRVIAIASEGDDFIRTKADYVLYVPEAVPLLTPVLTVLPLQLLAYYLAIRRGADVDQPRNLAKSVTVE